MKARSECICIPEKLSGKRETRYERLAAELMARGFNRRDFFRLAAASAGSMPLLGSIARASANFKLEPAGKGVSFFIEGVPVWTIDPATFEGTPVVDVKQTASGRLLTLADARFPGSRLAADFMLDIRREGWNWRAWLAMPGLHLKSCFRFDAWLLGAEHVRSRFPADEAIADLLDPSTQGEDIQAQFRPGWEVEFTTASKSGFAPLGHRARYSTARLELGDGEMPSLMDAIDPRRSFIWYSGDLGPQAEAAAADVVLRRREAPSTMLVESAVGRRVVYSDWIAGATLQIGSDAQGGTLALPVDRAQLVLRRVGDINEADLICEPTPSRHWHRVQNCSIEIRCNAGPLHLASLGSGAGTVDRIPATVERFVVPFPDVDRAMFLYRVDPDTPPRYGPAQARDFWAGRVNLDGYDLRLMEAGSGMDVTFRFRGIDLVYFATEWRLCPRSVAESMPLIECDLGSQHVHEGAKFSDAISAGCNLDVSVDTLAFVALQIRARCEDEGKPVPPAILAVTTAPDHRLASASQVQAAIWRQEKLHTADFDVISALVEKEKKGSDPVSSVYPSGLARARAANNSWITLEVVAGATAVDSVSLTLPSLFCWVEGVGRHPDRARLLPRHSDFAAAAPGRDTRKALREKKEPTRWPRSLADSRATPDNAVTAIEAPYRVVMSPMAPADPSSAPIRWRSVSRSGDRNARELWHIRAQDLQLRAIWSPDFDASNIWNIPRPYPIGTANKTRYRASLDGRDRHEFVALTSRFGEQALLGSELVVPWQDASRKSASPRPWAAAGPCAGALPGEFIPKPLTAPLLLLSSRGASMRYRGTWDPPASFDSFGALSVMRWDHNAQLGRDTDVIVEYKGALFPIGHPAVLVKQTTRKFRVVDGKTLASLEQRFYIRVPSFSRRFKTLEQPFEARDWPHAEVRMDDWQTPDLCPPENDALAGCGAQAFWPMAPVDGHPQLVEFEYLDPRQSARMRAPLVFVDNDVVHSTMKLAMVISEFRDKTVSRLSKLADWGPLPAKGVARVMTGKLSLVPASETKNSVFDVESYILDCNIPRNQVIQLIDPGVQAAEGNAVFRAGGTCDAPGTPPPYSHEWLCVTSSMEREKQPPFYPRMHRARVRAPQIAAMTGTGHDDWHQLGFDPLFVDLGFDANRNPGRVFGRFVEKGPRIKFGSDTSRSGGAFSPDTVVVWWSLDRGPVGGDKEHYTRRGDLHLDPAPPAIRVLADAGDRPQAEWAHRGEMNPMRYFGQALGDAKIAGCVRLADVLDVAVGLAGDRVPRINQDSLFAHALDEMQPLLLAIVDAMGKVEQQLTAAAAELPAGAVTKLHATLSMLQTRTESLRQALAVSPPELPTVIGAMTGVGKAATDFRDEVVSIQSNPKQLLPADLFDQPFYKAVSQVVTLYRIFSGGSDAITAAINNPPPELPDDLKQQIQAMKTLVEGVRDGLSDALFDELDRVTSDLAQALASSPELQSVTQSAIELASQAKAEIAALRAAIRANGGAVLSLLAGRLGAFLATFQMLAAWADWLDAFVNENCAGLVGEIVAFVQSIEETLRKYASTTPEWQKLQQLTQKVADEAARLVAQIPADVPNQPSYNDLLAGIRRSLSSFSVALGAVPARLAASPDQVPSLPSREVLCQLHVGDTLSKTAAAINDRFTLTLGAAQQLFSGLDDLLARAQDIDKYPLALLNAGIVTAAAAAAAPGTSLEQYVRALGAKVSELVMTSELWSSLPPKLDGLATKLTKSSENPLFVDAANRVKAISNEFKAFDPFAADAHETIRHFKVVQQVLAAPFNVNAAANAASQAARDAVAQRLSAPACDVTKKLVALTNGLVAVVATISNNAEWGRFLGAGLNEALGRVGPEVLALSDCDLGRVQAKALECGRVVTAFGAALQEVATAIESGNIDRLVNVRAAAEELLKQVGVPTSVRVSYDWDTEVKSFPDGASAVFVPLEDKKLTISSVVETDLRNPGSPNVSVMGRLDPFEIRLFGEVPFLSLRFFPLVFKSGSSGSSMDLRIDKVEFGGDLGWVQSLQEWLSPKNGVYAEPSASGIEVGYRFSQDTLGVAGLTLQNVGFQVSAAIPYDNGSALFAAQVSSLQKPFLISVGIWGGGGFVKAVSRIDALEYLEGSFEYGVVSAFTFGPAKGAGRITAGVYVRLGGRDARITGFFNASGAATIAGIITISACFRVDLSYQGGAVSGQATFTIKAKIGFVEYGYSVGVAYSRDGDASSTRKTGLNDGRAQILLAANETESLSDAYIPPSDVGPNCGLLERDWNEYWRAFARPTCHGGAQ